MPPPPEQIARGVAPRQLQIYRRDRRPELVKAARESPDRGSCVGEREDEECVAVWCSEHAGEESLEPGAPSDRHGDVLPAVDAVGGGAAVVAAAGLELPQQFAGASIKRVELAGRFA